MVTTKRPPAVSPPTRFAGIFLILTLAGFAGPRGTAEEVAVQVVGEAHQPLADVLVYLEAPGLTAEAPAGEFLLDQVNLTFVPRVLAVPVGATVRIRNSDAEMHNVNSGAVTTPFNIALVHRGDEHTQRFDEPGVVPLLCDVHPHMRAWVVALSTPHRVVTGKDGRGTIAGVPDGTYTLMVWREGKAAKEETVVVGGAPVALRIALPVAPAAAAPVSAKPTDGWPGTVARVRARLAEGLAHAEAGRELDAATACYDAYFVHYEAEGMETAVRENVSSRRAFEDEEWFSEVRESLVALARRRGDREAVVSAMAGLIAALEEDVVELAAAEQEEAGSIASTANAGSAPTGSAAAETPAGGNRVAADDSARVTAARPTSGLAGAEETIRDIRVAFAQAGEAVRRNERPRAAALIGEAYFTRFHRLEATLAAHHPAETARLERGFQVARGEILAGTPAEPIAESLATLARDIDALVTRTRTQADGPLLQFLSSLLIIIREGFEALIILSAMLAFLSRSGRGEMTRAVYGGAFAALAASFLTAWGFRTLLTVSPAGREAMEGITMLLAAGVLFYVSYWFIANSQIARWNRFVQTQVKDSLARGSALSLGLVAFLAVYREGAETVLFYEALAASAGGWTGPIAAGLMVGSAALLGVYGLFRLAAVRLPMGLLFRGTSTMLYVMAFIMAGKGIAELQEAGWVGITPISFAPSVPFLGMYPTMETASLQGVFLGLGVIAFLALRASAARAVAEKAPARVPVSTT